MKIRLPSIKDSVLDAACEWMKNQQIESARLTARKGTKITIMDKEETNQLEGYPQGGDCCCGPVRSRYLSEEGFKAFVGAKIIAAKPMDRYTFLREVKEQEPEALNENQAGFLVRYPDGYESWSPFDTFVECYREIGRKERYLLK